MSRICQVDVLDYKSYSCLHGIQKMKCVWNDDSSGHILFRYNKFSKEFYLLDVRVHDVKDITQKCNPKTIENINIYRTLGIYNI